MASTLLPVDQRVAPETSMAGGGDKGFLFFLFGVDGGGSPVEFDEAGSANLRASCGSPPFISRRLSI
jgi:hypothetical protein